MGKDQPLAFAAYTSFGTAPGIDSLALGISSPAAASLPEGQDNFIAMGDFSLGAGAVASKNDAVGRWSKFVTLSAGEWKIKAKATTAGATPLTKEKVSTFTQSARATSLATTYETGASNRGGEGRVSQRQSADGTRLQTFTWDHLGLLLRVLETSGPDGFEWTAIYDPEGRRIRTVWKPRIGSAVSTNANEWVTEDSRFDPLVEFMEIAVTVTARAVTRTQWLVHGADLDGTYGAQHGSGSLEALVVEGASSPLDSIDLGTSAAPNPVPVGATDAVIGVLDDAMGHVNGFLVSVGTTNWKYVPHSTQSAGYGPVMGTRLFSVAQAAASAGNSLTSAVSRATAWHGHRIDPTGLYWLGDRYYDPATARFISPDPLGHDASVSLYDFCGGDPVNHFDPTGRASRSIFNPQGNQSSFSSRNQNSWMADVMAAFTDHSANYYDRQLKSAAIASGQGWGGGGGGIFAAILDFGLQAIPGVNLVYTSINAAVGRNIITGQKLSAGEAFAQVGMAAVGTLAWGTGAVASAVAQNTARVASGIARVESFALAPGTAGRSFAFLSPTSVNSARITDPARLLSNGTGTNPYPAGVPLNAGPAPKGMVVNMAMSPGQPINKPGAFATLDDIIDVSYARNQLAIIPEFKAQIGFVQSYEIIPGTPIQWGPVGPQTSGGIVYPGGGDTSADSGSLERESVS